jgi:hypothetical protein
MKTAILDDYQNVALRMADWSALPGMLVEDFMLRVAIIIGSTRPGRKGKAAAKWD